ncbi:unnamed protein product [Peronospora destructor]|uniref:STIL N-terminal domain-containing protein n=1 Tax=Peronospora destructor TaxID=86335 RepID=A0AAV0TH18_9STRA|nr:unnamed protein product [Peronospora destructor]
MRHFHQFDDELQDSDQTILTSGRQLRPRTRLSTVADVNNSSSDECSRPRRRQLPNSAFFSDTTDDDASQPIRSAFQERFSLTRHVPKLYLDAIAFPMTRSVLWDRRRLSKAPAIASLEQILPRFIVSAQTLKDIFTLYTETSTADALLCYLYGDATSLKVKKVLLKGVKLKKKDARAAGTWCIPVHVIREGNDLGLSQENYVATIATVQNSYQDEYSDDVATKFQLKLLVFRSSPHTAQLDFQLECAASPVLFKFSLIRNLPLLMTPLAVSLARREFSTKSGNLRSGYLTLDRTRKAVPLLKVDPLVLQQPLVGVWVYGVQIDDAWDEEIARRQLADPLLYFACIGYLMSEVIKERVGPENNTFLVALYPASNPNGCGSVASLPRFFECGFSEFLSPRARLLPMELYSHRRSCLVGASKLSADLEFTLSVAPTSEWEAAKRQAKISTAPRSKESENKVPSTAHAIIDSTTSNYLLTSTYIDDDDKHKELTRGWAIAEDVIRKSPGPDLNAQSQTSMQSEMKSSNATISAGLCVEENEEYTAIPPNNIHNAICAQAATTTSYLSPSNETEDGAKLDLHESSFANYRSCCKSQQLLTIQHQQILENQQRQLHEMQKQIVQLRRLLNVAKNENKNETNATSNDEGGYDSDASTSGIRAVGDVCDASSTFGRQENSHLSSQSRFSFNTFQTKCCGFAADLSSSSVVDEQPNEYSRFRSQKETNVHGEQVESGAQCLNQSQLSQSNAEAKNQDRTVQANNNDIQERESSENVFDAREGTDNSTSAHELSIDELSTSLHKEAIRKFDKIDVACDDDSNVNASGDHLVDKRLLSPDAYLRKVGNFVDHHGGCFTTPSLDFHSFCVPRIKFLNETPECDSDDEEIRLIEQKYKRLMAA